MTKMKMRIPPMSDKQRRRLEYQLALQKALALEPEESLRLDDPEAYFAARERALNAKIAVAEEFSDIAYL